MHLYTQQHIFTLSIFYFSFPSPPPPPSPPSFSIFLSFCLSFFPISLSPSPFFDSFSLSFCPSCSSSYFIFTYLSFHLYSLWSSFLLLLLLFWVNICCLTKLSRISYGTVQIHDFVCFLSLSFFVGQIVCLYSSFFRGIFMFLNTVFLNWWHPFAVIKTIFLVSCWI